MKKIITHTGRAHHDDFLAVCVALAHFGDVPVERRPATQYDLEDPEVLVLDEGYQYDVRLNNFDHHQRGSDEEPECTLSLLARHIMHNNVNLYTALCLSKWFKPLVIMDVAGPTGVSRHLGCDRGVVLALRSPIATTMLKLFEEGRLSRDTLLMIGSDLIEGVTGVVLKQKELDDMVRIIHVGGVPGLRVDSDDCRGLAVWRDNNAPGAAFSITHDDPTRGEGWALTRFDNDPRIDLSRLQGLGNIIFAHKNGFLAKTGDRKISPTELIAKALV